MAFRDFLGRVADAIGGFLGREAQPEPPQPPEPYYPPTLSTEQPTTEYPPEYQEPYQEPYQEQYTGPVGSYGEDNLYYTLAAEYGVLGDASGMEMLWNGWFQEGMEPGERSEWRLQMANYIGYYHEDSSINENLYWFDWEAWRDYMGYERA